MFKLCILLLVPGIFAEYIAGNNRIKSRDGLGKRIANSLLYSYLLFLLDISVLHVFFRAEYAELLELFRGRMKTVEDLSLFTLLLMIQLVSAYIVAVADSIRKYRDIEKAFLTMSKGRRNHASVILLFSVICALFTFVAKENAEQSLVINEVCSKNDSVCKDENGKYSDYVELYNPSKWSVSLKGFRLSDQTDLTGGLDLGKAVIPAKGHYIAWLSEETASFGISSKGETVSLAAPDGEVLDRITVPELERNISFARATDGAGQWQEEGASPGFMNDPLRRHLAAPVFSEESGFYGEEFLLSIHAEEGANVYYTLDCSVPDRNANLYTDEILVKNVCEEPNVYLIKRNVVQDWDTYNPEYGLVDKLFIVRAVAMDAYGNTSDVVTKTYLVDMDEYKDYNVVSLVSEPDDLFGDDGIHVTGREYEEWYAGDRGPASIIVNFLKKGREAEIEGSMTYINNNILAEQEVGMRIQGASTRYNPFKRFSIYARKEYSGSRYFEFDLFDSDTHAMYTRGDFGDPFIHSLVADRNVGTQKAVPAKVFLLGEFWYNTYLREKYNEDYLAMVYNVPEDKVEILERVPDDLAAFLESHDLSKEADYQQFCELIDVQSYIDYMAINIYACNMDLTERKNYKVWRTTEKTDDAYGDERLRWLLYDADCLNWYGADCYKVDSFSEVGDNIDIAMNRHTVYTALRANEAFCKQFVLTFMDIANHNFARGTVADRITEWGYDISWNGGFFYKRFDAIVPALAKEFDLQGTLEEITLSVNDQTGGYVQINTITPELTDGSWTGSYYTDYPVTITAIPNEGYRFVGWKCGEEMIRDTQIEVQLEAGGCRWEAVFE